ncbi:putative glycoside hydrolase family 38 protein [Paratrimastix pyriformis]|uniref:Glycoside hydrolase family 38 protein n=1 Tax=Paratrimastix pyriformis TaxID=342808 RepID=A0ABQ8UA60_9EUKA|nr:putative glycoside hydrolase family 38 protein [Paratrimastix pyriformis]
MEATQLQRRQRYPQLTKERVKQFRGRIAGSIYSGHFLSGCGWPPPQTSAHPFADAMKLTFRECKVGERFGPNWSTHWVECTIPLGVSPLSPLIPLHLLFDCCAEGLVYSSDGVALIGLSGSTDRDPAVHLQYNITPLVERARAESKGELLLFIEVACNGMFGVPQVCVFFFFWVSSPGSRSLGSITWGLTRLYFNAELTPPPRTTNLPPLQDAVGERSSVIGQLRQAEVAVFRPEAWKLLHDFTIVSSMACDMAGDTATAGRALDVANAIVNAVDPDVPATWPLGSALAQNVLGLKGGVRPSPSTHI